MFSEHFKFPIDFTRTSKEDSESQDDKTQDSSQQQGEIALWWDHAQTPLVQFIFSWSANWFGSDPIPAVVEKIDSSCTYLCLLPMCCVHLVTVSVLSL